MRPRATVIVNSSSGTGCPPDHARRLEELFASHGIEARVLLLGIGAEIVDAAKQALDDKAGCVVAGGGDGTVSAVASVLAGSGVPLGVLPLGTLNHFAKDLGMPLALEEAVAAIAQGVERDVDMGEVNGRLFINNSSLGLYPDIVLDRERQRRRLGRGKWMALAAASFHAARRYPLLSLSMDVDGERIERRSAFVFIGNNGYTMEGFEIGERERLDAGVLSLYVTQRKGRFGLLLLALRALFRRLEQARDFDSVHAENVTVHTKRRHELHVSADGEVLRLRAPLEYRIRPRALRVIAPTS